MKNLYENQLDMWNGFVFWVWIDQELFCEDDQTGVVLNACCEEYLYE